MALVVLIKKDLLYKRSKQVFINNKHILFIQTHHITLQCVFRP